MLNMGAVLLLLIGVTDGVKTFCDATQPHITTQCFGSLGGTVEVLLPKTSQDDAFRLKKNRVTILSGRIQTNIRYSFNVSTGIFTIKDIDRKDNGEYSMEVHNTTGNVVAFTKGYLTIQAPVSSLNLSRECLSRGQQRVSCSAGGDGLHYSWSLDGLPLNDTRLPSGPSSASDVTLEPGRSGLVTCSVHNNVSHATANITLSVCDGVTTFCDATQPDITTQCFGSLGGTVEVLMLIKTSRYYHFRLKKNNITILSGWHQANIRYSFNVRTGIFTIKDIDRTDNGEYSMEVHNTTGMLVASTKCYLTIEAPVSSPLLSRECLSRGQQRVSCSAGGDGLHYSWSLDGLPLNDPRLLSGPSSASDVTLEPGRSGLLTCSVRNIVSNATANITLSVCGGVKTVCDATQPRVTTQCFGSLGGTVKVQILTKTSQDDTFRLKKNKFTILSERNQTNIRYSLNVRTGIFTIKDIDRKDNGTYSMEVHTATGKLVAFTKCYLTIQAPVSSPLLSRECLSWGQQRVSCSAGGDGLHHSWSLDGLPLNDPRLPSAPSSASDVTLEPGRSGLLTCSVRNIVSNATANINLSVCGGFIYVNCTSNGTHISQWVHRDNNTLCSETAVGPFNFNITRHMPLVPFIARSLTVVLLLLAPWGVYWALKKKKTSSPRDIALSSMAVDDDVPLQSWTPLRQH
ncbi:uncharacterized protein LOC130390243 [Gadus chalcogrammus]|uniref:uncharacterized protein LOC130390243 n=1 Tax=Gadus chalcogrammus TaxID=1042646 RepID=UPI0024C4BC3F|nr:uncharacterized protein LOC130390243 [Gadus chalcogrammus]